MPAHDDLTPIGTMDDLTPLGTVDDLTPLGTVNDLTPLRTVDDLTPLGTVDDLTPLGTVDYLTPLETVNGLTPLGTVDDLTEPTGQRQTFVVDIPLSPCPRPNAPRGTASDTPRRDEPCAPRRMTLRDRGDIEPSQRLIEQ